MSDPKLVKIQARLVELKTNHADLLKQLHALDQQVKTQIRALAGPSSKDPKTTRVASPAQKAPPTLDPKSAAPALPRPAPTASSRAASPARASRDRGVSANDRPLAPAAAKMPSPLNKIMPVSKKAR